MEEKKKAAGTNGIGDGDDISEKQEAGRNIDAMGAASSKEVAKTKGSADKKDD